MNPYPRLNDQAARRGERRAALELIFGLLIVALLIAAFLKQAPVAIDKARLAMMMSPLFEGRIKVIEHHALTGDWPDEIEPLDERLIPREDANLAWARIGAIRQGAIQIEVHNRKRDHSRTPPEWWSVRPVIAADDAPTVLWVCASRAPPAGFRAFGEDRTTLPPEISFRFC